MVILKGYDKGREVWAVAHTYGSGETAETFFCYLDPNAEVLREYERAKNGFYNYRGRKTDNKRINVNNRKKNNKSIQGGK